MELGNMLFGNSRGNYPIDRGMQDMFCEFLADMGFDSYGYADTNTFVQHEQSTYEDTKATRVSVDEVTKYGEFVRVGNITFEYDGIAYAETYYKYNGKTYVITPWYTKSCQDSVNYYEDAVEKFLEEHSDYSRLPEEILALKPALRFEKHINEVVEAESSHQYFDNGVFLVRPYYWGESGELASKPNFVYKDLEISWYKYPLRDAYSNKKLTKEYLKEVLEEIKKECKDLSTQ